MYLYFRTCTTTPAVPPTFSKMSVDKYQYQFTSIDSLVLPRSVPIDHFPSSTEDPNSTWVTTISSGKEKIVKIEVPLSEGIPLHSVAGSPLAQEAPDTAEPPKPSDRKCRNRECNKTSGQAGKPRSIYCSKKCQSREQNLRQGRVKSKSAKKANHSRADAEELNEKESPKRSRKAGAESPIDSGSSRGGSPASLSPAIMSAGISPPSSSPFRMDSPTSTFIPIQNANNSRISLFNNRSGSPQAGFVPIQPPPIIPPLHSSTPSPPPFPSLDGTISPSFDSLLPSYMGDVSGNFFSGRLTPLFSSESGRFTPSGRWTPNNMLPDGRSTPSIFFNYSGRWTPSEFDAATNTRESNVLAKIID